VPYPPGHGIPVTAYARGYPQKLWTSRTPVGQVSTGAAPRWPAVYHVGLGYGGILMRTVVFNRKGGVGKSSITVNLAAIAASEGRKTLVVDLDPQCNASQYLLGMEAYRGEDGPAPNIGSFFAQTLSFKLKEKAPREYVHTTRFENLYVLPANGELGEVEHLLESKHKIYKLRGLLKTLAREFDAIYVDTPPAFNFY